jgi:anthranilate phosphoribosyltransferase
MKSMSRAESSKLMGEMIDGTLDQAKVGETLLALREKGESLDEVLGFLDCLKLRAVQVPCELQGVIDVCGTGGDRSGTFNVSTVVSLLVASLGVKIAKHGNRSVSSKSGSFDVLEKLGIGIQTDPQKVRSQLEEKCVSFLFAPFFHPALAKLAPIRKSLGVYTVFNILGPLLNPVRLDAQLMGVFRPELMPLMAQVLLERGLKQAMVVHGDDGLDEITISARTKVAHLKNGVIDHYSLAPEDFGFPRSPLESVRGGSSDENAKVLRQILEGQTGPKRNLVLMNAAAALLVAGKVSGLKEGVGLAAEAVDSKRALHLLEALVRERSVVA